MKNKFERISDFVSSLERGFMSEDEQAILLVGKFGSASYDNHQCNNCGGCVPGNFQCNNGCA